MNFIDFAGKYLLKLPAQCVQQESKAMVINLSKMCSYYTMILIKSQSRSAVEFVDNPGEALYY